MYNEERSESFMGRYFCITNFARQISQINHLNNLNGDPLEIQHPKFENSRLGFIESVHER